MNCYSTKACRGASSPFCKPVPGSTQIALLGLESASDSEIRQYAKDNGYVIVSRDSDFQERSLVTGHPPQVIWLKIPNRSKTVVLNILLEHQAEIEHALTVQNLACVELSHHDQ